MGQQRLCDRGGGPEDPNGPEERDMAGAGRDGSLFTCFVRLRGPERWLDGLGRQFSNGLGVRSGPDGNIALTGELHLGGSREFTLGLAFGESQHHAISTLFQALAIPFKVHEKQYTAQWGRAAAEIQPLQKVSGDKGNLYQGSFSLLRAHEDKSYPGAFIASLAIPWGEAKGDQDQGGYHLVWTRDMVNSASGMLAAGDRLTPLRALIYLAVSQQEDGGFAQNFWVNGDPYWRESSLTKSPFPSCWPGVLNGRTPCKILTRIPWF